MNVERLRSILQTLRQDIDTTKVDQQLQQLANAMQEVVNQPGNEGPQNQVVQTVEKLNQSLATAPSNSLGPIWTHAVEELGLERMLPSAIQARLAAIFQRSQITPNVALAEVQKLRGDVIETRDKLAQLLDGINYLGVRDGEISADHAEVGMLIPRPAIDNNLNRFSSEAHLLNRLLNTISEAISAEPVDVQIKSISTTDILVYVIIGSHLAKIFAEVLAKLVDAYVKLTDVRVHRDGLKDLGLKKADLAPIDEYANASMGKAIDSAVADVMKITKVTDAGRKNELKAHLTKLFWNVAKRLDVGYNFDVRASDQAESSEDATQKEDAKTINKIRKSLEFVRVTGESLLELPAGQELDDNDDSHDERGRPADTGA